MRRTHFLKVFQELRHTKELVLKKEMDNPERIEEQSKLDVFGAQYDMQFSEHAPRVDGAAVLFKRDLELIERGTLLVHKIAVPFVHLRTSIGPLMFASLHLKWQRNDTPPSEHLGRRQLLGVMDALAQKTDDPIVLAGDFNANSQSCVIDAAEQRGYRLSCRSQRPWDTTNINRKRRKIDYILTNTTNWSFSPCRLPRLEKDTPMPSATHGSDHLALSVQCR